MYGYSITANVLNLSTIKDVEIHTNTGFGEISSADTLTKSAPTSHLLDRHRLIYFAENGLRKAA
jgi:hypothetical protein